MQWNILSKSELMCNKSSFPKIDEKFLEWNHRRDLFTKIFAQINPDIICLQEVDDYDEIKENFFSSGKYESEYFKKNGGIQGIAIFYNPLKLTMLYNQTVTLPKDDLGNSSSQNFVFCIMQEKISNKIICLITTHLKSKTAFETVRLSQVKFLLKYIDEDKNFLEIFYKYSPNGIIMCGDFNAEPNDSCMQYVQNFRFQNNQLLLGKDFKSAYNFSDKEKENYIDMTTFKIRDRPYYRIIDYIFYTDDIISNSMTPTLSLKDEKFINTDFKDTGLPCGWFPSDHYYLTAKLNI